jgi:uncharacterized protein (TIGR03067 family)
MRAVLMIAVVAVAVPDRPERNPTETRPLQEKLQGEWQMVSAAVGGKTLDASSLGAVYVFRGNRLATRTPKQPQPVAFEIVLDTMRTPAFIDFIAGSAGNKTTYPGIFKIEGDTLTLCFPRGVNVDRPTEFASTPDRPSVALYQLKRVGN